MGKLDLTAIAMIPPSTAKKNSTARRTIMIQADRLRGAVRYQRIPFRFNTRGKVVASGNYENGLTEGVFIYYFENGKVEMRDVWENGVRISEAYYRWEDTQVSNSFRERKGGSDNRL